MLHAKYKKYTICNRSTVRHWIWLSRHIGSFVKLTWLTTRSVFLGALERRHSLYVNFRIWKIFKGFLFFFEVSLCPEPRWSGHCRSLSFESLVPNAQDCLNTGKTWTIWHQQKKNQMNLIASEIQRTRSPPDISTQRELGHTKEENPAFSFCQTLSFISNYWFIHITAW